LQAVVGDNSFNTALANRMALLELFLRDNFRGSVRVQEAMTDDQAHEVLSAAGIGFGAAWFQNQTASPPAFKGRQQLVITLAAEAELSRGLGSALACALADDEHGQTAADLVVITHGQDASGPGETELFSKEGNVHSAGRIARRGVYN
jgi:hypothetical protein